MNGEIHAGTWIVFVAVFMASVLVLLTDNAMAANSYFLPAASTLRVGSAPFQVTSAVGP